VNIGLNLALMKPLGFKGLALATSFSAMVNMFTLLALLRRRIGPLDLADLAASFLRILGASAAMGAGMVVFQQFVPLDLEAGALGSKILYLLSLFLVAAAIYIGLSFIMKSKELRSVLSIFSRKRQEEKT
jgi:putative peptidoglycan lipid II flippase